MRTEAPRRLDGDAMAALNATALDRFHGTENGWHAGASPPAPPVA